MNRNALLLATTFCLIPVLANAEPRAALLKALGECATIAEAPERLSCYDKLAPQFQAPAQTAEAPPAPPAPPTKEQKESWFGLDNLFGGGEGKPQATPEQFGEERIEKPPGKVEEAKEEQVESITAKLSDYAKNSFGKFIVFLDNGQVWQQISGRHRQSALPQGCERQHRHDRARASSAAIRCRSTTPTRCSRSSGVK